MKIMDVIWLLDRVIAYLEMHSASLPETIKGLKITNADAATIRAGGHEWRECNELLSRLRDFRGHVCDDNDAHDEERRKRH